MREDAVLFSESLAGIVTTPPANIERRNGPAFIFLNSGILHRVGACCLHVKLARELARLGFLSFRIDFSGIGDSPARGGGLSIGERWVDETTQAINYLMATKHVERFVLLGNCSGAYIASRTSYRDPRVVGAILINLQGPKTYLRYYLKLALTNPKIWLRLFAGAGKYRDLLKATGGLVSNLRKRTDQKGSSQVIDDDALRILAEWQTKIFLIYCSWDPGLQYFNAILKQQLQHWIAPENLRVEIIPGMDHAFSLIRGQNQLREMVRNWAKDLTP